VLVEGDDLTEPVSDASRGILDGHIALSRKLAARAHYPAIDLLESISRLADTVCDEHHIAARRLLLKLAAAHAEAEELINIGAYARGSNQTTDAAIAMKAAVDAFLQQSIADKSEYPRTCKGLIDLAMAARQELSQRAAKAQHATGSGAKPQAPSGSGNGAKTAK
jgi:flagellar biosynthesis/type III secretory pathway ATPase